jgi:hypothetical protein
MVMKNTWRSNGAYRIVAFPRIPPICPGRSTTSHFGRRSHPDMNSIRGSTTTNPSPLSAPQPAGGAFSADLRTPPKPPADAVAVQVRDDNGRTIAFAWVVKEHAGDRLLEQAWSWYDEFGVVPPPQLSVVRANPAAVVSDASAHRPLRLL